MLTKVYGRPAVECERPGGELVPYCVEAVPTAGAEWRAWVLTGPEGRPHRVAEYPSGSWSCDCGDFANRFRRCRKRPAGSPCLHITALTDALAAPTLDAHRGGRTDGEPNASGAGQGHPLPGRGRRVPAAEGQDPGPDD